MKILILTTTFPRWKDDVTPGFVFDLCKQYQKDGYEVIVLAPHDPEAKKFETMDGIKVYRFKYFLPAGFQRLAYGGGILPNFNKSLLAKIQAPLLFVTELGHAMMLIRKEKIDVIHSHWIIPNGLIGGICKKIFVKKHIMTLHGAGLFALEKLPLKKGIARFILINTDEVAVVSDHIKNRLLKLIDGKIPGNIRDIDIIPMGIYSKDYSGEFNKGIIRKQYGLDSENILLAYGRLVDKKGFPYCIKAMPDIISHFPDTKLVICGDGPDRNELEKLCGELKLKEKVVFKGYISAEEKLDYLKMADILIVPSIVTNSGDTEGLPVVLLEGLASGVPIVASDVGGINDAIINGSNGFLVKEKDASDIANKISILLSNKDIMERFSQNARITSKNYDWVVIGQKYENFFKR